MGAKNELSEKWFCEIFYTLGQCLIDLGSASLITFLLWSIGSITNRCWGNEAAFLAAEMEPTGRQGVQYGQTPLYGHRLNMDGQVALSLVKQSPYIFSKSNPLNTDTPLIRTLFF